MTERLFVDTSAWFAFSNRSDPAHAATAAALKRYDGGLVTSNFTDCTSFILLRRLRLELAAALDDHFRREGFQTLPHVGPRPAS